MPQWVGAFTDRITIARLGKTKSGLVAGKAYRDQNYTVLLADNTGTLQLSEEIIGKLEPLPAWVALFQESNGQQTLRFVQPLGNSNTLPEQPEVGIQQRRWHIHQAIRQWFLGEGFTEVDTPVRVACPGMEPYLDSFAAGDRYLRTSPELHMKRLLAAGFDPIFQIGASFRVGDHGSQHREEFLMLEWYRLFADLNKLIADLAGLLTTLAPFSETPAYFQQPLVQKTCTELFEQHVQVRLKDHHQRDPLIEACRKHHIHYQSCDDWDTLFFRIFLEKIEPYLGLDSPTIVTGYPASMSALAKKAPVTQGELPTCMRFELYLRGVEIANAFYELTDPEEQRQRFEVDRQERKKLGKPVYEIDEAFMAALNLGLPPAAGIALGMDRLVMALLNLDHFDHLLPFP